MIYAVGDIHGKYDKLDKLLKSGFIDFEKGTVVFLGDYIDRGEEPLKCLETVKSLIEKYENVIALKGNHEDMMINYYDDDRKNIWLYNGGDITFNQLEELSYEHKQELKNWVRELPLYYKTDECIFVHAGFNPHKLLKEQTVEDYLWIREEFYLNYKGDTLVVVGHTPTQFFDKYRPFISNNILFCDTGAFIEGGKLSCVRIEDKKIFQV